MLAALFMWSVNIKTCMSDTPLLLFSCLFIRIKVHVDELVDKIYTNTRTFAPAFLLLLSLGHREHKKNRTPIWTKHHLLLASRRAWFGCRLDHRLLPVSKFLSPVNTIRQPMSSTPPSREPAVVVHPSIRILLNEAQTLGEPIYLSPSHQMLALPYSHH